MISHVVAPRVHGAVGTTESPGAVGTAITQVSVDTAPTRAWTVPTIDGDCSSATGVASTTCPIGTVTLTCPSSYPGAEMVSR